MYRSLYFKIILIFVIFMVTVMAVVGTILLNSVYQFYTNEFTTQMEQYFEGELRADLLKAMESEQYVSEQKERLRAYSASLGIDVYRNFYILDMNGDMLDGSSEELGRELLKTPNMLRAMNGSDGSDQLLGSNFTDYAVYLNHSGRECIVYIKDTQEEMQMLSWQLFSIILQAVFFGLLIAVVLSFFLAKAITSPIQSLTQGAQLIAAGNFGTEIHVHSSDEIGTLTNTFNHMGRVLRHTLDEVSGERQKLETIFSYLKDAVIAFSDQGQVLNINKCARELFGAQYDDQFTLEKMLKLLSVEYAQSYMRSKPEDGNYVLRDVEFGDRVLDLNLGLLKYIDENETHTGSIAVMHDITSRYELDKAQREFVANVSHELKTPLAAVKSATESILLNPDMPDEFRESFLNIVVDESDRMLRIVNDLLTLSRFDNRKTQWKVSSFDVRQSIKRVCDVMRTETASHHHKIYLDDRAELPWITGDRERIEQVLINIISNALKYTPDGGRIDIRAVEVNNEDGDDIVIHVRDNGIGIPDEEVSRLFERFYRVDKSRTSDTGGTGLGLAIAKEIVTAHGGTISIKSRLGVGTIVTIVLPVQTILEDGESANGRE